MAGQAQGFVTEFINIIGFPGLAVASNFISSRLPLASSFFSTKLIYGYTDRICFNQGLVNHTISFS